MSKVLFRGTPPPLRAENKRRLQQISAPRAVADVHECVAMRGLFSPVRKFHCNQPVAESRLDLLR